MRSWRRLIRFLDQQGQQLHGIEAGRGRRQALRAEDAQELRGAADLEVNLSGQKHNITGLFGIDEKKLNELPDDKFLDLRKSGALSLAYMQLLSVGQVQRLVVRHNIRDAKARGETIRAIAD